VLATMGTPSQSTAPTRPGARLCQTEGSQSDRRPLQLPFLTDHLATDKCHEKHSHCKRHRQCRRRRGNAIARKDSKDRTAVQRRLAGRSLSASLCASADLARPGMWSCLCRSIRWLRPTASPTSGARSSFTGSSDAFQVGRVTNCLALADCH
jgi:hypothetical protein